MDLTVVETANDNELKDPTCRICLKICENKSFCLNENYKDDTIITHIKNLTQVILNGDDKLPDQICKICLLELDTALHFKEKCLKSEQHFLNFVNETSIVNITKNIGIKIEYVESSISEEKPEIPTEVENSSSDDDRKEIEKIKGEKVQSEWQCNDCKEVFKSKCKLRVHWKRTHLLASLVCPKCKLSFKTISGYNNHVKSNIRACSSATHMRIEGVGKNRMFYCKYCDYKSNTIQYLVHHIVIHNGDRPYKCDFCYEKFTQNSSLIRHKEAKHDVNKHVVTCQYCGKTVVGRDKIYRHLHKHRNIKKYECNECNKQFKNKDSLKVHMLRHGAKTFTCELCAKPFYTVVELRAHIVQVHHKEEFKRYKCDKCDYGSFNLFVIKKHRAKHTDVNISCSYCGRFFIDELDFKKHQKRHIAEKKISCTICDKKYLTPEGLRWHMKSKHPKT